MCQRVLEQSGNEARTENCLPKEKPFFNVLFEEPRTVTDFYGEGNDEFTFY